MPKAKAKAKKLQETDVERKAEAVFIPKDKRVPTNPAYLHMSKKDFLAAEKNRKEKDLKTKQYRENLDEEENS